MRKINLIVIHCSDSPNERDIGLDEITQWHKARGFTTVGYHYVIRRDGKVETGRQESVVGAHVKNHNSRSLGICLIGKDQFSKEQMDSLHKLVKDIKTRRGNLEIKGHYEFDSGKTCPNLDMNTLRNCLNS